MEHEHSTVGEVGSPAKQRPKKLGGSAAYNTKFYSKWCSKYPVKASSFQTCLVYVVCSKELSCVHYGEADRIRYHGISV
jgi:hypothetical protein